MTLTWPKTMFTKKTLIFSTTVNLTKTNMLQNDVKYRYAMKPSYFSNELQLVFLKKHII